MATVTTPEREAGTETDQCIILDRVDWPDYEAMLRMRGERSSPRIVYLDGRLSLVSPSYRHESLKIHLEYFVAAALSGLGIEFEPAGSTTYRREQKKGGAEGDTSYYIAHRDVVLEKETIDLSVDPPPDLVVEVVVSHDAEDSIEVYRRFGVPEVWIFTRRELLVLILQPDGSYARGDVSIAIPGITAAEVHSWIIRRKGRDIIAWMDDIRRWSAEVVAPRSRGGAT
ncbi:Uma2 family endonuclease [Aquisphaera insulae]|uniref:Uma2 family endonuclease n=1 Tax=Aquisphaera insulae TaxID=2712864 RepID=UPI0013EB9146|nr:Uma2 family endonuclease [Aquisphaera insulae]